MFYERHVTGLFRRGASWEVQRKAGESETFDAVVLTMPVPQILQLQGDLGPCEFLKSVISLLCGSNFRFLFPLKVQFVTVQKTG